MTDNPTAADPAKGRRARWRKPRLKILMPGTPSYDRAETLLGAALRRPPGDQASSEEVSSEEASSESSPVDDS